MLTGGTPLPAEPQRELPPYPRHSSDGPPRTDSGGASPGGGGWGSAQSPQPAAAEGSESPGVRELMSMGFSRTSSRTALEASGGEVQSAAEMLLEQPDVSAGGEMGGSPHQAQRLEPSPAPAPAPSWGTPIPEHTSPYSQRAGPGGAGAGWGGGPGGAAAGQPGADGSFGAADLISSEAATRGISAMRLSQMLQELQAVTSVSLTEAQELLLAANLDLNRAVEHFFTSGRVVDGVGGGGGGAGGGGAGLGDGARGGMDVGAAGGSAASDSWAVQEAAEHGLFADGSIESAEELAAKKALVDKINDYKSATPAADGLPVFDVVQFAWERMGEGQEAADLYRQYQAEAKTAHSIRQSMSLGFQSADQDMGRFDNMSARECARVAAHCGQLDVEEKKAGMKKWRRKWFALWHSPAQLGGNDMVLLCFEDEDAYKPTGTARLERGKYQVQPPKQPRRGHPNCFRISIDSAGGADKKGKYILNALSKESMEAWVEALQPQVGTHLSALLCIGRGSHLSAYVVCALYGVSGGAIACGCEA